MDSLNKAEIYDLTIDLKKNINKFPVDDATDLYTEAIEYLRSERFDNIVDETIHEMGWTGVSFRAMRRLARNSSFASEYFTNIRKYHIEQDHAVSQEMIKELSVFAQKVFDRINKAIKW